MDNREERISKLSQRFTTHAAGRPKQEQKVRERRSFYLDARLMERLDQEHKAFNHKVYPNTISKSVFLEAVLEDGLAHLDDLQAKLFAADTAASE